MQKSGPAGSLQRPGQTPGLGEESQLIPGGFGQLDLSKLKGLYVSTPSDAVQLSALHCVVALRPFSRVRFVFATTSG